MPAYIAIGDIHGMYTMLEELLAQLPSAGELIFLGDYIDRGPAADRVIARLLELRDARPCRFLRGNHEEMCLAALGGDRNIEKFWLLNGGLQTLESYQGRPPASHVAFLHETLDFVESPDYIFVHAGLQPGIPPEENTPETLRWIREPFLNTAYDWGRLVIHGHTPTWNRQPEIRPNRINIDTGAVYGGALTAVLLPEMEFISVPFNT